MQSFPSTSTFPPDFAKLPAKLADALAVPYVVARRSLIELLDLPDLPPLRRRRLLDEQSIRLTELLYGHLEKLIADYLRYKRWKVRRRRQRQRGGQQGGKPPPPPPPPSQITFTPGDLLPSDDFFRLDRMFLGDNERGVIDYSGVIPQTMWRRHSLPVICLKSALVLLLRDLCEDIRRQEFVECGSVFYGHSRVKVGQALAVATHFMGAVQKMVAELHRCVQEEEEEVAADDAAAAAAAAAAAYT